MESISELLMYNEYNKLEFKKCENKLPKSFWETYSSFANTSGGTIILGYDETTKSITGVEDIEKIKNDLFTSLSDKKKTNKNLITDDHIETIVIEGKKLLKIRIDEALYTEKPVYINNDIKNTFIRRNSADIRVSEYDLKFLMIGSIEETDAEILKNFDINDFNIKTIDNYRNLLVEKKSDPSYLELNHEDFLIEIGAYKKDRSVDGKYRPTKGALLLFGKLNSIYDIFPSFQLDFFEKDSSLENRWIDRVTTGDISNSEINNILDFYNVVNQKISLLTKDKFIIDSKNKSRLPFKNDLEESVREALVNSLMHALYDSDFPIKISACKEYFEFENPGQMRVTIEEFISGKTSRLRNHVIANLLKKVGISEKAASGGEKIFKVAERYNLKTPEIIREFEKTTVRIWKVDITHNFKDFTEIEQEILYHIYENGSISKSEINMSAQRFRKVIDELIKKDQIVRIGKGRSTRYTFPQNSQEKYLAWKKIIKILDDSIDNNY